MTLYLIVLLTATNNLPTPLTLKDEPTMPNQFIAQRAQQTLRQLTKLGPRVVGSKANEYDAVAFLLQKVEEIRQNASDHFFVETDVQMANGNYIHWEIVNMYQGIQNVVVKLSARNATSENYLLINSHYDSVPGSTGGGDDGTMVVVMLEVMRTILWSENSLEHPIVFLFNGAEENPLQASHAFITQHKWAKNCKALINLDSAGSGGRDIIFQSGPNHPWLMRYYRQSVLHPFASTMAEELFQHGFIKSDTDFRIFRDFGGVPGLDMAHTYNGYVYHTKYDRFSIVPSGTLQNTGDNILELAKAIANAPEMHDTSAHKNGHVIFYDILGWFLIFYNEVTGIIINVVICSIALLAMGISLYLMAKHVQISWVSITRRCAIVFVIQMLSLSLAWGLCLLVAVFMDTLGRSMAWYSQNWLIFGLYFCPMIFGMGILPAVYLHRTKGDTLTLGFRIQLFMHSHCLFLCLLTIFLTVTGIRSAFIAMIAVLFGILELAIHLITNWHRTITITVCQIVPFLFYSYLINVIFYTMLPMAGLSGPTENPDIIMAEISLLMSMLLAGFIIPVFMFFRKTRMIFCCFLAMTIMSILLALTPVGFPYTKTVAAQRLYLLHTRRVLHNYDMSVRTNEAGIYLYPQDRHINSIDKHIQSITDKMHKVSDLCKSEMFCGLPHYNHRWNKARNDSFWIPVEEYPIIPGVMPELELLNKNEIITNATRRRFQFRLSGPDHMAIFVGVKGESKIVNWSFNQTMIRDKWKPPFFIYFSYGKDSSALKFFIDVEKSDKNLTAPSLEIGIGAHWVHQNITRSKQYQKFIDGFPDWSYVSDWVANYESWIY